METMLFITLLQAVISIVKNDHFDKGQILRPTGREEGMSKLQNGFSNSIMQLTFEIIIENLLKMRVRTQAALHFLVINPYKSQNRQAHKRHAQYWIGVAG